MTGLGMRGAVSIAKLGNDTGACEGVDGGVSLAHLPAGLAIGARFARSSFAGNRLFDAGFPISMALNFFFPLLQQNVIGNNRTNVKHLDFFGFHFAFSVRVLAV